MNKLLTRLAQAILIISMAYAGSFIVVEETSEKTKKTERAEEALHHADKSKAFIRWQAQREEEIRTPHITVIKENVKKTGFSEANFNIKFIYTTSYLDSIV